MSAVIEGTAPSSTKPIEDRMRTRKVKGEQVTEAQCRFCDQWQTADDQHFFPHRASGGLHLRSRCRGCEGTYRSEKSEQLKAGERVVVPRTGIVEIDAEAAKKVFDFVLANWAVKRSEVVEKTGLDEKIVTKLLKAMEGPLVASTHVNSEVALTWQPLWDVANEKGSKRTATAAFKTWLKEREAEATAKTEARAAKAKKDAPVEMTDAPEA